jgi:predicted transcriptional regulator
MARTPKDITDAELAVLEVLWARGPASIRQVSDDLYPSRRVAEYATVQKLLERLEGKRVVRRDRGGAVHLFSAIIDRNDLIGRRLRAVADSLCGGSLTPLLSHLVQSQPLTAGERRELRALIDALDDEKKRPPKRRDGHDRD